MTQPVFEPSDPRALAGLNFGERQLRRRPAPASAAGSTLPYIWMSWAGPDPVPVSTISNPATMGTPDTPYNDFCSYDPDNIAAWFWDLDDGCIGWGNPGEYLISLWAAFDGGATAGSHLGVLLEKGGGCTFSAAGRGGNMIVADAINETWRINYTEPFWDGAASQSLRLMVYHNDAGGQDLESALIHIVQINPNVDCTDP